MGDNNYFITMIAFRCFILLMVAVCVARAGEKRISEEEADFGTRLTLRDIFRDRITDFCSVLKKLHDQPSLSEKKKIISSESIALISTVRRALLVLKCTQDFTVEGMLSKLRDTSENFMNKVYNQNICKTFYQECKLNIFKLFAKDTTDIFKNINCHPDVLGYEVFQLNPYIF